MRTYKYVAVDDAGKTVRGSVDAENEHDLELRLKDMKLELVSAEVHDASKGGGKVKTRDLIVMCMHLEQLDRAGVPLHDAIADVRDSTESNRLRDVMTGVYEAIKSGKTFSQALSGYPNIFNDVFVGLVAAGEKTGDLSTSFIHLGEHLKWMDDLKRKVKKAIRYPLMLLIVLSAVITVLMMFTVPKMLEFISSQGFDIPIHTRALMAVSSFFGSYWYLILGLPVAGVAAATTLYKTNEVFAYNVDVLLLKTPLIGPVLHRIDMARFVHFFSVMFNSGIDVVESLDAAKGVVSNRVLRQAIDEVKESVTSGSSITASLRSSNQFPNLVVRMFKVGEDSGNMKEALDNVNFFYNREVNDSVDGLVGSIQPIMTMVMGVLIFWIVASVFGPLYQSFSKLKT